MLIYTPKGKAREYSPLALNLYKGCNHGCKYCYVPKIMPTKDYNHEDLKERNNVIDTLRKEARKHYNSDKQVLMSFTTDPYNSLNDKLQLTSQALEILLFNRIPTAILTKGGMRIIQDLEVIKQFGKNIKVGFSLTYDNDIDSLRVEPGAEPFTKRLEALKILKENNIYTWISLEPVLNTKQTLNIIDLTHDFVNEYQIGKLNHFESKANWKEFLINSVTKVRSYNKNLYVKIDLAKFRDGFELKYQETATDYLTLKKFNL